METKKQTKDLPAIRARGAELNTQLAVSRRRIRLLIGRVRDTWRHGDAARSLQVLLRARASVADGGAVVPVPVPVPVHGGELLDMIVIGVLAVPMMESLHLTPSQFSSRSGTRSSHPKAGHQCLACTDPLPEFTTLIDNLVLSRQASIAGQLRRFIGVVKMRLGWTDRGWAVPN